MAHSRKIGKVVFPIVGIGLVALGINFAFPRLFHIGAFWVQPLPSTTGSLWINLDSGWLNFAIIFAGLLLTYFLVRGLIILVGRRKTN